MSNYAEIFFSVMINKVNYLIHCEKSVHIFCVLQSTFSEIMGETSKTSSFEINSIEKPEYGPRLKILTPNDQIRELQTIIRDK